MAVPPKKNSRSRFRSAAIGGLALLGALSFGGAGLAAAVFTSVAPPEPNEEVAAQPPALAAASPSPPTKLANEPVIVADPLPPAPPEATEEEKKFEAMVGPLPKDCPDLPTVAPRWLPPAEEAPPTLALPESPASLERRVKFWMSVWGGRNDDVYGFSDIRRPWIVHGEVDCRDIPLTEKGQEERDRICGGRLTQARKEIVARLTKTATSPRVLRLYDGNKSLAKTAAKNIIAIEGRKDALSRAQERSARDLPLAEALFARAGVPRVYARTAFVESLWRPDAFSKAGAAGAFQFMQATGKAYLKVDAGVDERLDALRASWAAARYLKDVSRELKSWPLVLTAYNQGPARMKGLIKARRTRDLGRIVDGGDLGSFGFDGQNYYSQIVAVARLTDDTRLPPLPVLATAVEVSEPVFIEKLATCLRMTPTELARANPALTTSITSGDRPVPAGYVATVPNEAVRTASR